MNTAALTRDALWAGVHTAVDSNTPSDLGQQLKEAQADVPAAMDIDGAIAVSRGAAQAPAGPDSTVDPQTQQSNSSSKHPSSSDSLLQSLGAAADNPERLDVRAPPAAASLAWQPKPDGTVTLRPAVAAMADADDPGEDDVDQLQPDDYEYDDDVTAVGGDIMGVGPTYGTVGGDPTQNLGGLGPQLQQQLLDRTNAAAGSGGGGGGLSQGDADVRGRRAGAVHEDADLALRPGGGAGGSSSGGAAVVEGGGLVDAAEEYGPEGMDALDAGAIATGDEFVSQPYVRHRSSGHTGIDPDPRLRPDPNPKRGLALEGGSTAHPVDRSGDFAMGSVAVPAFGADAVAVRGLEYTVEPKYAAEVAEDLQEENVSTADDEVAGTEVFGATAAASSGIAAMDASGGGGIAAAPAAAGAGINGTDSAGAAARVANVGRVAGGSDVEGSGPVLLQQVGLGQLQQSSISAATAAQPSSATDARHLGAIFGGDAFGK